VQTLRPELARAFEKQQGCSTGGTECSRIREVMGPDLQPMVFKKLSSARHRGTFCHPGHLTLTQVPICQMGVRIPILFISQIIVRGQ